ncbi:hypothetical protein TGAM01_v202142 [Trichoderma gamsii]|uniref:Uncharacterized protein n=1 Tax=Trichoderma gamsii TaxID=398673 RepID=A0A2P4ZXK8_9HYPO|nr:hypothetical protein TGAM01_v202142 [Trichoderma gamsii]PON29034.1 hypothetical protein TGAM01_v202142 [Trichoderma gamsii]
MSYSAILTLPNLRGKLRPEVLRRVDRIVADLRAEVRPLTMEHQTGVQSTIKNALHNRKKELSVVEKLIGILHEEHDAGHLDTADEELCLDRYNLDRRRKALKDDSGEGQVFGTVDDETMDAFLADVSDGPSAPRTMSPLSEESHDSMDAIEIEIDGQIVVQGEDSEEWEGIDDEDELGEKWVDVDENVHEDVQDDEDGGRDIFKTAADLGLNFLAKILRKQD